MSLYASRKVLINATLMIKIYNNIIPFKGYKALVMWPLLFVRKGARFGEAESGDDAVIHLTDGGYLKLRLIYYNDSKAYRAHRLIYNHW